MSVPILPHLDLKKRQSRAHTREGMKKLILIFKTQFED